MISWIIIGRNWEENLDSLFLSINNQTAQKENYEIIFVDDKSTDNSIKKLEVYINKNQYKIIKQSNHFGRGAARNIGINYSSGDWCIFSNSNTYPEPNFINDYINKINNTNADIISGEINYECLNDIKYESYLNSDIRGLKKYAEYSDIPYKYVLFGNCAINKKILKDVQFNESILLYGGEELEFISKIKGKKPNINIIKSNISVRRANHPSFISQCYRMIEFGYNVSNFLPKEIRQLIIPNYINKIIFFIPTSVIIKILQEVYKNSSLLTFSIIRLTFGTCIIKGIKKNN